MSSTGPRGKQYLGAFLAPRHGDMGSRLSGAPPIQTVTTQIANHLALSGGKFKPDDLVLVMAGGNDLLFQLSVLQVGATVAGQAAGAKQYFDSLVPLLASGADDPSAAAAAILLAVGTERARLGSTQTSATIAAVGAAAAQPGNAGVGDPAVYGPMVAAATADAATVGAAADQGPDLVTALALAGAELATLVKSQVLANGARYVVVNNLPDVAQTPAGRSKPADTQVWMTAMAQAFNAQLSSALSAETGVLLVDVYALTQQAAANPSAFGLTNVTETACDLSTVKNALGSSLVCNGTNLTAGDVSRYAYADDVHPTPYFYAQLATQVEERMVQQGWR